MPYSLRRSGRKRQATTKHTENDSEERSPTPLRQSSVQSAFSPNTNERGVIDEDGAYGELESEPNADQDANDTDSDALSNYAVESKPAKSQKSQRTKRSPDHLASRNRAWAQVQRAQHSRGVQDAYRRAAKTLVYQVEFGPDLDDLKTVLDARDTWFLNPRDAIFPSRQSLVFLKTSPDPELDPVATIKEHFPHEQDVTLLALDDVAYGSFMNQGLEHEIVLGPADRQQLYVMPPGQAFGLHHVWTQVPASPITPASGVHGKVNGWLINLGQSISCLSWSSSIRGTQYLAVSCSSTSAQRATSADAEGDHSRASAFRSSNSYPSSIQIWSIEPSFLANGRIASLDQESRLQLHTVLCLHFGGVRQLKWFHVSPSFSPSAWLAALTTDGSVHLFNIPLKQSHAEDITCYLEVRSPSLSVRPPSSIVFTTFTFASFYDLIVGASDGTVRLYNILSREVDQAEILPYLTLNLHSTYITAVEVAGDGDLSHFLASTSAAGDYLLTDLRSPDQDRVHQRKARVPTRSLVYCPLIRSFVMAIDAAGQSSGNRRPRANIIAHQLRHSYASALMSKFPLMSGSVTTLAASKCHPFLLAGDTQGTVRCQNMLSRIIPTDHHLNIPTYVQKVCEYSWRLGTPTPQSTAAEPRPPPQDSISHLNSAATIKSDLYHIPDTRSGVSRFHEGFRPQIQDFSSWAEVCKAGAGPSRSRGKSNASRNSNRGTFTSAAGGLGLNQRSSTSQSSSSSSASDHEKNNSSSNQDNDVVVGDGKPQKSNKSAGIDKGKGKGSKGKVAPGKSATTKPASAATNKSGTQALFEEEQAVSAMAWNQDLRCAGWVAIGWGSGIVRIQDLSHGDVVDNADLRLDVDAGRDLDVEMGERAESDD